MAHDFELDSSQYIEVDSAVVTAYPFSMVCWFNSENDAANQFMVTIVDKSQQDVYHDLRCNGAASNQVQATSREVAEGVATTSTGYTVGTWHHAAGVFTNATLRAAFIDGGSKGTNATNITPTGLDRTSIGRLGRASPSAYMDGLLAEIGIWNVALTDEEVARLAAGYSPLLVRPGNLVLYMPLVREIHDIVGGIGMVNTGTVVAPHPPISYPTAPLIGLAAAAAVDDSPTEFAGTRVERSDLSTYKLKQEVVAY